MKNEKKSIQNIWACLLAWKAMVENIVRWFIARKKTLLTGKKNITYKTNERDDKKKKIKIQKK